MGELILPETRVKVEDGHYTAQCRQRLSWWQRLFWHSEWRPIEQEYGYGGGEYGSQELAEYIIDNYLLAVIESHNTPPNIKYYEYP